MISGGNNFKYFPENQLTKLHGCICQISTRGSAECEAQRAESGGDVLGEGAASPFQQLRSLEEQCKLPIRVRGC